MELDPNQQADQDRRMIAAMGLTALVVFGYYTWFAPPPQNPAGTEPATEGVTEVATPGAVAEGVSTASPAPAPVAAPSAPVRTLERDWEGIRSTWSSLGGSPQSFELPTYVAHSGKEKWLPTWLMGKVTGQDEGDFALGDCPTVETDGVIDVIRDADAITLPVGIDASGVVQDTDSYRVVEDQPGRISFVTLRNGIEITKSYDMPSEGYVTDYTVTFRNTKPAAQQLIPSFGIVDFMPEAESRYGPTVETHASVDEDHETADEGKLRKDSSDPPTYTGEIDWFAVGDKYFFLGLEPKDPIEGTASFHLVDGERGLFSSVVTLDPRMLAPNEAASFRFKLWSGPKLLGGFEKADMAMASSVDFGIFGLIAIPILYFLKFLFGLLGNWGLAIIALTFTVKLLLFPLTQKQYRSMKDMQELNPEITALREKYEDDKEAMNKEMMKLFSERGVNPMGGCLPMIIQMPIWFALYRVLWMSADIYQAPFLYMCDLTLRDPLGLLPIVMIVTQFISMKMNQSPTMDPAQQRIMTLMPVVFGFIMFTLPAGLVLYIVVNVILSIVQQWVIKREHGEPAKA